MTTTEVTTLSHHDEFEASARDASQRFANAIRCNAPLTPSQSKWSFFDLLCLKNLLTSAGVNGEAAPTLCRRYFDQIIHSHPLAPQKSWSRKDQVAVMCVADDLLLSALRSDESIVASKMHMPISELIEPLDHHC